MQKPSLNALADLSSRARSLNFGLGFHLHPYLVYASNKGSGEPAQICICAGSPEPLLIAQNAVPKSH